MQLILTLTLGLSEFFVAKRSTRIFQNSTVTIPSLNRFRFVPNPLPPTSPDNDSVPVVFHCLVHLVPSTSMEFIL